MRRAGSCPAAGRLLWVGTALRSGVTTAGTSIAAAGLTKGRLSRRQLAAQRVLLSPPAAVKQPLPGASAQASACAAATSLAAPGLGCLPLLRRGGGRGGLLAARKGHNRAGGDRHDGGGEQALDQARAALLRCGGLGLDLSLGLGLQAGAGSGGDTGCYA